MVAAAWVRSGRWRLMTSRVNRRAGDRKGRDDLPPRVAHGEADAVQVVLVLLEVQGVPAAADGGELSREGPRIRDRPPRVPLEPPGDYGLDVGVRLGREEDLAQGGGV